MRTFIALDPPAKFADDTATLARALSTSVEGRFLSRDTYHLTLTFPLPIEAETLTLHKSILDREGTTYKPLYKKPLKS